jgi:2-methylcitrate dehydratase PrpD
VVEVTLTSGEQLTRRVDHALGEPSHPLAGDQLVEKFLDCAAHSATPLSRTVLDRVIDQVSHLESVTDVGLLLELLSGR